MPLRINTNVQAMGALRNLTGTIDKIGLSIQRLSTGLRINSAADDPAGLIISEGMRSQLRGVDQAMRNSQDAVNMAKTAEGALAEVQKLILDMRAITVHAANNAVVDSAQLQADQAQLRSLLSSVDRIAGSTAWGTKKLLDGTAGTTTTVTDPTIAQSIYIGGTFGGYTTLSGPVNITQTTKATVASLSTNSAFASTSATIATKGTMVLNGFAIVNDGTDTVQSMMNKINAISGQTGIVATSVPNGANVSIKLENLDPGAQYKLNLSDPSGVLHNVANVNLSGVDGVYNVSATTTNGLTTSAFTGGRGPQDSGLKLSDLFGNTIMVARGANDNWGSLANPNPQVGTVTSGAVQFQIGPNSNQSVIFSMPKTYAGNMGIGAIAGKSLADVDVTTTQGANDAMKIVDQAITQLASMRGDLGSFQQNFLESTVRSLGVTKENLTAAESDIRDADMAEEMTKYTQLQILQQSGLSVLSQANQQPNSILSLLRGQ